MKYIFKAIKAVLSIALIILFSIGATKGLSNIASKGYNFYQAHKAPKYAPEKYMIITERNSAHTGTSRSFILKLETLEAIDIKDDAELTSIAVELEVNTKDYNRLYAGGYAPSELKEFCCNIKFQLHDGDDIEWGHNATEQTDNSIEHRHIKDHKIVGPSKKCDNCQRYKGSRAKIALN